MSNEFIRTLLIFLCAAPGEARGIISQDELASYRPDRSVASIYFRVCDPINAPLTCLKFIQGKTAAPLEQGLVGYRPCSKASRVISNINTFYCKRETK